MRQKIARKHPGDFFYLSTDENHLSVNEPDFFAYKNHLVGVKVYHAGEKTCLPRKNTSISPETKSISREMKSITWKKKKSSRVFFSFIYSKKGGN
jgi:hypothetical protein